MAVAMSKTATATGKRAQMLIRREFSLEGMLDSFTQSQNVTVNLNTPSL
jgi:hypothetical protein